MEYMAQLLNLRNMMILSLNDHIKIPRVHQSYCYDIMKCLEGMSFDLIFTQKHRCLHYIAPALLHMVLFSGGLVLIGVEPLASASTTISVSVSPEGTGLSLVDGDDPCSTSSSFPLQKGWRQHGHNIGN